MSRWFWDAQLQLLNTGINWRSRFSISVCVWNNSWIGSGTLRSSMQGVRKIEKSVVGVRNCMNHLGFKLSNSQACRGQFASGLKIHVILKQGPFQRENNNVISLNISSFRVNINRSHKNQFQQTSSEDHSRGAQLHSLSSGTQNMCSSTSQNSQEVQELLHPQYLITESQNDFSYLSIGEQS